MGDQRGKGYPRSWGRARDMRAMREDFLRWEIPPGPRRRAASTPAESHAPRLAAGLGPLGARSVEVRNGILPRPPLPLRPPRTLALHAHVRQQFAPCHRHRPRCRRGPEVSGHLPRGPYLSLLPPRSPAGLGSHGGREVEQSRQAFVGQQDHAPAIAAVAAAGPPLGTNFSAPKRQAPLPPSPPRTLIRAWVDKRWSRKGSRLQRGPDLGRKPALGRLDADQLAVDRLAVLYLAGLEGEQGEVGGLCPRCGRGGTRSPPAGPEMLPASTAWPAYRLTPRRCDCESRPLRELALPFSLCAIAAYAPAVMAVILSAVERLAVAGLCAGMTYDAVLEDNDLLARPCSRTSASTLMPLT